MRKLVVLYFILINLAGFTMALLDGSNMKSVRFDTNYSDLRMTTVAAFGGSPGVFLSYNISDNSGALNNREFSIILQVLILQNIVTLILSMRSFGRRKRSADIRRSSLSLK
ncbi:MAG: hypothetical protein PQJ50_11490 [Spirochaetales bacterium]|nr:hypothetical protein [Spirochaetales bacterium]